jgi:hypothetical protein
MCFIYFGVKRKMGKKEGGTRKREGGTIIWGRGRSADRTMNLWGWLGGRSIAIVLVITEIAIMAILDTDHLSLIRDYATTTHLFCPIF